MNTITFARTRETRNDLSATDFSGLVHTAEQKKAMEAWAGRLHPLENLDPPSDEGSLAALAIVVVVGAIGTICAVLWAVRWALS